MSDCNVCLYGESDYVEFFTSKNVRAAKDYKCCECYRAIVKGTIHQVCGGRQDGEFWRERTCLLLRRNHRRILAADGGIVRGDHGKRRLPEETHKPRGQAVLRGEIPELERTALVKAGEEGR